MLNQKPLFQLEFLAFCLCAVLQTPAASLYYNTSSATQTRNTLDSVSTNGSGNSLLFTATGPGSNNVSRCTALAVDGLNGKLFLLDGGSNALWSVNLAGGALTLVKGGLTNFPTDLALDVLNEQIYYTTSSTLQSSNTVQRVDYTGNNHTTLFTATGVDGNKVSRCTALAVDIASGKMFLADAGARTIWSMSLTGTGVTALARATASTPTDVAVDVGKQQVYFTFSSPVQSSNFLQRVNYDGSGLTNLFTASGGVLRCTALDVNVAEASIYLSDAGTNALWRIPLGGGSATGILNGLNATPKRVRWYNGPETRPPPGIIGIALSGPEPGTKLVLNATNGYAGGTYYLLTSTNVLAPVSQWELVSTNVLGTSGDFTITSTNAVFANAAQQFYILKVH